MGLEVIGTSVLFLGLGRWASDLVPCLQGPALALFELYLLPGMRSPGCQGRCPHGAHATLFVPGTLNSLPKNQELYEFLLQVCPFKG